MGRLVGTSPHEVHVVMGWPYKETDRNWMAEELSQIGFNPQGIHFGFGNAPRDATLYFCDGLRGDLDG